MKKSRGKPVLDIISEFDIPDLIGQAIEYRRKGGNTEDGLRGIAKDSRSQFEGQGNT